MASNLFFRFASPAENEKLEMLMTSLPLAKWDNVRYYDPWPQSSGIYMKQHESRDVSKALWKGCNSQHAPCLRMPWLQSTTQSTSQRRKPGYAKSNLRTHYLQHMAHAESTCHEMCDGIKLLHHLKIRLIILQKQGH